MLDADFILDSIRKVSAHSTHHQPKYRLTDAFVAAPPDIVTRVYLEFTATQFFHFCWSKLVKTRQKPVSNGEIQSFTRIARF